MKKIPLFFALGLLLVLSVHALNLPVGVLKLQEYQTHLAFSITFFLAFLGGLLTFTSPCGFVLLPTFFSYVFRERNKALFMTTFFCFGLFCAFIIFGLVAGLVGTFFNLYKEFFATLSGILLIFFGILMILNKGFSLISFRSKKPASVLDSFLLGFFFAIGWTPCVGPILGGVLLLAATTGYALKGALLFGVYALGISIPLLVVSALADRIDLSPYFTSRPITFSLGRKKFHTHLYGVISGVLLILVGAIMFAFKGTRVFMTEIPKYVPWTMTFFTRMNETLVANELFTGRIGNVLGIGIAALIIIFLWRKTYKA